MAFQLLARRLPLALPTQACIPSTLAKRTMATKKQGGSSSNGRDSIGRRLGVKVTAGQKVSAGSIIVRQRGQKFRAGENAGMGKDHTIFAKYDGIVKMSTLADTRKKRKVVSILV